MMAVKCRCLCLVQELGGGYVQRIAVPSLIIKDILITSAKEVMFLPAFFCLSVCLSVSNITQKVINRF